MARVNVNDWLTEESLLLIEGWARDGLTNEQIAQNIGCHRDTLNTWSKKHSVISDALKKGKEVVDIQVENALLKRALGFHYIEEMATPAGEVVALTKYEKPDVTAGIYWLRNRKRDTWNNKDGIDLEKIAAEIEYTKKKTALLDKVNETTQESDVAKMLRSLAGADNE